VQGDGFAAIEQVCDLIALIGSKSGHVDPHAFGTYESYDRTAIKGSHVVKK
jgi:hypothetical protein